MAGGGNRQGPKAGSAGKCCKVLLITSHPSTLGNSRLNRRCNQRLIYTTEDIGSSKTMSMTPTRESWPFPWDWYRPIRHPTASRLSASIFARLGQNASSLSPVPLLIATVNLLNVGP